MAIVSQTDLILQRREWKRNGKRVVCVTGAFDLLHPGHVRLLEHARGLADILIVGVRSDASRLARKTPRNYGNPPQLPLSRANPPEPSAPKF